MSRRTTLPRGLGPCDLLTVAEALAVLGLSDTDGRQLLRERGLVRNFLGRPRVVAGDLVRADDDAWQGRPATTALPPALPTWEDLE